MLFYIKYIGPGKLFAEIANMSKYAFYIKYLGPGKLFAEIANMSGRLLVLGSCCGKENTGHDGSRQK